MLDLGSGTGETSAGCLDAHPDAVVVAVDGSAEMTEIAAGRLGNRAHAVTARLEDRLPTGRSTWSSRRLPFTTWTAPAKPGCSAGFAGFCDRAGGS